MTRRPIAYDHFWHITIPANKSRPAFVLRGAPRWSGSRRAANDDGSITESSKAETVGRLLDEDLRSKQDQADRCA
jgi:hypothetical protein